MCRPGFCPSPRGNEIPTMRPGEEVDLCDRTTYSQPSSSNDLDPLELLKQAAKGIFRVDADKNGRAIEAMSLLKVLPEVMFGYDSGTGWVIGTQGNDCLVLTNDHVIGNARNVKLTTQDRGSLPAAIELKDSGMDMAVLRIRMSCAPLPLARSISDASQAAILSFPLGSNHVFLSVTDGKIKVVTRAVLDKQPHPVPMTDKFLVIEAHVAPGGSGSPVFMKNGEVIGMTFAAKDTTRALAIPFTEIARLKARLKEARRID